MVRAGRVRVVMGRSGCAHLRSWGVEGMRKAAVVVQIEMAHTSFPCVDASGVCIRRSTPSWYSRHAHRSRPAARGVPRGSGGRHLEDLGVVSFRRPHLLRLAHDAPVYRRGGPDSLPARPVRRVQGESFPGAPDPSRTSPADQRFLLPQATPWIPLTESFDPILSFSQVDIDLFHRLNLNREYPRTGEICPRSTSDDLCSHPSRCPLGRRAA